MILHNAALTFTMLLQQALTATNFEWRAVILECVDAFRKALTGDAVAYAELLSTIVTAGHTTDWSRPKPGA